MIQHRKDEILQAVSDACDKTSTSLTVASAMDEIEYHKSRISRRHALAGEEATIALEAFRALVDVQVESCRPMLDMYAWFHRWSDCKTQYHIGLTSKYTGNRVTLVAHPVNNYSYNDAEKYQHTTFIGIKYSWGHEEIDKARNRPMLDVVKEIIIEHLN